MLISARRTNFSFSAFCVYEWRYSTYQAYPVAVLWISFAFSHMVLKIADQPRKEEDSDYCSCFYVGSGAHFRFVHSTLLQQQLAHKVESH